MRFYAARTMIEAYVCLFMALVANLLSDEMDIFQTTIICLAVVILFHVNRIREDMNP